MKRCALYVRVSTQEQKNHGLSVDSQIVALQEYCADHDYQIVNLYNDAGISARKKYTKRPALLELLEDCKAGKIDLILFTKLDRWFRSVGDYYEVQNVLDQNDVKWRTIWEDYETETSSGVFKVNIMLSVAQSEADRTSERIKMVNEYKRSRGDYVGTAPCGYKLSGKNLIKDPDQEEAVTVLFDSFIRTANPKKAFLEAKNHGLNCTRQTALRMLRNPVFKGEAFGGYKCDPYITPEQFDHIQNIAPIVERQKMKKENNVYYFAGMIRCAECGGVYSGTFRRMSCGKEKRIYKYYRCVSAREYRCDNTRSITELKIERFLLDQIEGQLDQYKSEIESQSTETVDVSSKIEKLNEKIRRIGDRYEEDEIDREEYLAKKEAITREIQELKKLNQEKRSPADLPSGWREAYSQLDEAHRKVFWRSIIHHLTISKDGEIKIYF